jgi:complex iron-sulfur molybdoenzyme family reductase subunit gamma
MHARYVDGIDLEEILDFEGRAWQGARTERLQMIGTPVGLQPAPAIVVSWAMKQIGAVDRVDVAAVHNGSALAFRLEWKDPTESRRLEDTTSFVDGAGVLLPSVVGAPIATMGAEGQPVNAWQWRADQDDGGNHVVAEGLGTTRPVDGTLVKSRGVWKDGRWRVVIGRPMRLQTSEPVAQLQPGQTTQFGVAIWEGSRGERAGIKAYSVDWRELVLDAALTARR